MSEETQMAEPKQEVKAEPNPAAETKKMESPPPASSAPVSTQPKNVKFELKLPEGTSLGKDAIERTVAFARERGLSPEQAQAVLERESASLSSYVEGQKKLFEDETNKWYAEFQSDKEFGGDKFEESRKLANRALVRFGDDAFINNLRESGFNNHPGLTRLLVRVGRMTKDDSLVMSPAANPSSQERLADRLYSKTKEKESK